MVVSVLCDMCKDSIKDAFFEMNKLPKKEPINFCKLYDNEGTTQVLLRSDYFINPTVWYLLFGLNLITSIPVTITRAPNGSERSGWYAQRLLQGHFFRDEQFPNKESIYFCKIYGNEGTSQLLLRSDHFINPTVWYPVFAVNFISNILVIISYHKGIQW